MRLTDSLTLPTNVRSVDLDGDGLHDLLTVSTIDNVEVWYRNLGGGSFGPKQTLSDSFTNPVHIGAADLSGDGIVDIYGGSTGDGNVHWYLGLGNGEFADPVVLENVSIHFLTRVQAADVDSDGDIDLLVARNGAGLRWHENLGAGQFQGPPALVVPQVVVTSVQMADMDGDGTLDLVYDEDDTDRFYYHQGLGGGAVGPAINLGPGTSGGNRIRLIDLDGNGDRDLVYVHVADGQVRWKEGLGVDGLGPAETIAQSDASFIAYLEVCDLDGDQDLDVAYGSSTSIDWAEQLAPGQFTEPIEILPVPRSMSLACGDFDGDGHLDLAFSTIADELSWTRNLGSGLAFSSTLNVSTFVAGPRDPVLADLDGDGDLDTLAVSGPTGSIILFENIGGGEFASRETLLVEGNSINRLHASDLDGDGDLDLVWQNFGELAIRWLEQLGPQAWAPPAEIDSLPSLPIDMAVVDLDQDGDLDIVQPLRSLDRIHLYRNLGGAQFSSPIVLHTLGSPRALAVGALTSSGLPDVVVRADDGRISWHRNNGQLTFFAPTVIAQALTGGLAEDLALADLTGNGRQDPIWTDSGLVRWRENLNLGVFGPTQSASVSLHARFIEVADIDTDGDPDLMVASSIPFSPSVVTLENSGGQLGPPVQLANTPEGPRTPATGDIDGDGDLDVLLAYEDTSNLEWRPGEALEIVGTTYCGTPVANSTGQPGSAFGSGSLMSGANDFTLHARQLPTSKIGIFLVSPNQGFVTSVPDSVGTLCLGASIGRFNRPGQILVTSQAGTASLAIDLDEIATPTGTVAVQPGETWNFQFWHRDNVPSNTSNFTQGVSVLFQ